MDTILINSENSKTSDPHRLLPNLTDKINLIRSDKYVALSNLNVDDAWKNIKSYTKRINLNISPNMEWRIWISWLIIFSIRHSRLFWVYHQKLETVSDNPSIKLRLNKIENKMFKIEAGYYLKLLTPETMKIFVSTKIKTTKDENGENVCHLEITEVVLTHCNIVNNDYQQDSRVLHTFVTNKSFGKLLDISKILYY